MAMVPAIAPECVISRRRALLRLNFSFKSSILSIWNFGYFTNRLRVFLPPVIHSAVLIAGKPGTEETEEEIKGTVQEDQAEGYKC
jgi:hypothetical protein